MKPKMDQENLWELNTTTLFKLEKDQEFQMSMKEIQKEFSISIILYLIKDSLRLIQ
jgi:hypothetical protein